MARVRRTGRLLLWPASGLLTAVLLLGGRLPALAADQADLPPTLPVAKADPLPASLRRAVPESVEELRAIEQRVQSLIGELQAVTVGIRRGHAQGTGVIISKDGYVLTAAHVSGPPGRPVTIVRNDGTTLEGVALGRDERLDAGLIRITEKGNWPVAKVGDVDHLKHGDWVIGTGHPGGFDRERLPVVRLGRVIMKLSALIQTDVALVGGDSGGPLFDLNGRVIGIHSRIGPANEYNFHVPISAYSRGWHWMIRSEERPVKPQPGGPMLGVDGEDVKTGCRVTRVSKNSPAEKAGLAVGDVITKFDDRYVTDLEDLVSAVNHYLAGESVNVVFKRDGERRTQKVTLAARPETKPAASE